jgi:asparagine N-glycosylation enzyme membrane subunit Stt3
VNTSPPPAVAGPALPRALRVALLVGILVVSWLLLHALLASTRGVFEGLLNGPDSYMRLVRVEELARGGGWFDSVIERSNAPYGDELHWTRPLDVILLILAAPLIPFVGLDDALFAAAVVAAPLVHLALLATAVWAATPLLGHRPARMVAVVLLAQPAVLSHAGAGNADHHALQLLALVATLGLLLRSVEGARASRFAVWAGVVAGLGIWVSAEMTILAGVAAATLVVPWIRGADGAARRLGGFALGLAAVTAIAILVERPPSDWLAVEYDRVSLPHLGAAVAVALLATLLALGERRATSVRGRALVAAVAAATAGAPLLVAFPGLTEGPATAVDPRLQTLWLDNVRELQPLWPTSGDRVGRLLVLLGPAVIGLPYALSRLRNAEGSRWLGWCALSLITLAYVALSLLHLRFSSFAAVPVAIAGAGAIEAVRAPLGRWRRPAVRTLGWVTATLVISVGFTVSGGVVVAAGEESASLPNEQCDLASVGARLDRLAPHDSPIVLAMIDIGPELLYRSNASVVSGPYHRNASGILDEQRFFASTNFEVSRAIAVERDVAFVLVCGSETEARYYRAEDPGRSLYEALIEAGPPSWLSPLDPDGKGTYRLFAVEARQ